MSDHKVLYDITTGIQTEIAAEDGKIHTLRKQDIEPFLRQASRARFEGPTDFKKDDGLYKRASIPVVEIDRWRLEYGFDWMNSSQEEKRRWMKTPHFKQYELRGKR